MKKTNKGFSMVELIIVIAIMAILAGALAPALIKYINKSRISTDISTGQSIATAVTTALSVESAYDVAATSSAYKNTSIAVASISANGSGDCFSKEFNSVITSEAKPKAKTCLGKADLTTGTFKIYISTAENNCKVYLDDGKHEVYPAQTECLLEETGSCSASGNAQGN